MTMTKRTFSSNEETRLLTLRKYTALLEKVLGKNILRFPSPHTEQYTPQRSGGGDGSKEAPKTQNVPRIFPMIVDGISRQQITDTVKPPTTTTYAAAAVPVTTTAAAAT